MILRSKCKRLAGYEVEWCAKLPIDEHGDAEHDNAENAFRDFDKLDDARAFAETVKENPYGCAQIRKFSYQPISDKYREILEREYDEVFFEEVS